MYSVYKHVNRINGKCYVGITSQNPKQRWGVNGKKYKNKCPHFYNAILKYGWDNFTHEILFENLSKEKACQIEKSLIKEFNCQDRTFGYNILEGGSAPCIPLETRQKMSKAMIGNKNSKGVIFTEERKQNISLALKGKPFTAKHKENISKAKKGKTHKSISEEAKRKIAKAHKKKQVKCLEINTLYESIQECSRILKIEATTICACCKGRVKSSHGLHFKYYNN